MADELQPIDPWTLPRMMPYPQGVNPMLGLPSQPMAQPAQPGPQLPPWLQKVGQFSNNALDRLGGRLPPGLNPQEQQYAQQQQRMSMIGALLRSAAPRPQGTGSVLGDLGTVVGVGQQAGQDAATNAMKVRLLQAQIAKDQYREVPAGGTLLGPDNRPVFTAPAAETGINSRFRTPQVLESGRVGVIDGQTGRLKYADSGQDVPATDPVSADLQVITLPDGSMRIVDMRRGLGGQGGTPGIPGAPTAPVTPRTAPLVSPSDAARATQDKAANTEIGKVTGEREMNAPVAYNTAQAALANLQKFADQASRVATHPGLDMATGFGGEKISGVSGTPAADAAAQILTLKSQSFVNALQAMRDASKTGGAVGNVSNEEGAKLTSTWQNLEQSQSPAQYRENLKMLDKQVKDSMQRVRAAYNREFGRSRSAKIFEALAPALNFLKEHPEAQNDFYDKYGYLP